MCGIFGISSTKPISNQLIKGLSKLEYRGYDAAGISGHDINRKLVTIKATGPIKNLKHPFLIILEKISHLWLKMMN